MTASSKQAFRGTILHCLGDPGHDVNSSRIEHFDDGLLIVENGRVSEVGAAETLLAQLGDDYELTDHRGKLIIPGMIDCHVHFSQIDMIASYGEQLLDWLNRYAFPTEAKFSSKEHGDEVAAFFCDELLRNGTTTALVFATVHPQSVDAILTAAEQRNMRLIAGKVLMDRHCPDDLRDNPASAYADSKTLIEKWQGQSRLGYAITPRFAVTSSDEQLAAAGRLAAEFPEVHIQTHLAEDDEEIRFVANEYPSCRSYFDVYEQFGLARERAVFAHCLHIDDEDRRRMADLGASIAFCPTSNLFLGNAAFDLDAAHAQNIRVGMGCDVGGGTSMSMLRTLSEGYKVLQQASQTLNPWRALYLATLGGAEALYLDDKIGSLQPGREADFVVLDSAGSSITERRLGRADDLAEKLFALIMLGDDRNVFETRLMGQVATLN